MSRKFDLVLDHKNSHGFEFTIQSHARPTTQRPCTAIQVLSEWSVHRLGAASHSDRCRRLRRFNFLLLSRFGRAGTPSAP